MQHLTCAITLLFLVQFIVVTSAQLADSPAPAGPPNITAVLEKAGEFGTFIRLLKSTHVGDQINNQLNNSVNGITVFAPTDSAFSSLPSGTMNSLTDQQQVALIQFHELPYIVSISQFQTISNPVRTQAGDVNNGRYPLNVTTIGNQVNITTGIVNTSIASTVYSDSQLAVYKLDQVLLPLEIFGPPAPAAAPAPNKSKKKESSIAESPSGTSDSSGATAAVNLKCTCRLQSPNLDIVFLPRNLPFPEPESELSDPAGEVVPSSYPTPTKFRHFRKNNSVRLLNNPHDCVPIGGAQIQGVPTRTTAASKQHKGGDDASTWRLRRVALGQWILRRRRRSRDAVATPPSPCLAKPSTHGPATGDEDSSGRCHTTTMAAVADPTVRRFIRSSSRAFPRLAIDAGERKNPRAGAPRRRRLMRLLLVATVAVTATLAVLLAPAFATGSASTIAIAIAHGTDIVCGILAGTSPQSVQCARADVADAQPFPLLPNISFSSISGGRSSLCGLRADGTAFFCWDAANSFAGTLPRKRVYNGSVALEELAVGDAQIAAVDRDRTFVQWWRQYRGFPPNVSGSYSSLTSGRGFTCAVNASGTVKCWGPRNRTIQDAFASSNMSTIVAGDSHVCGIDVGGSLICRGNSDTGQATPPLGSAFEFGSLALGSNHTCAIRRANGTVVCWGGGTGGEYTPTNSTAFEFIVAADNLTCGLTTANLTVLCWGTNRKEPAVTRLPLPRLLPGVCTSSQSSCVCGLFADSETLCSGSGVICQPCGGGVVQPNPPPPSLPPAPSAISSTKTNKGWLAFAIIGSVGTFSGVCSIVYCVWIGVCKRKKVHNSVQPTITAAGNGGSHAAHSSATGAGSIVPSPFTSPSGSRSRIFRRQGSRVMRRQRSGPSSFKDRAEEFSLSQLAVATKNFSLDTKIGAGSFGTVYKGKLPDGREVAIKRSETGPRAKKFQEKESAFQSELAFLSRLHHKHLVGLVGYCEEKEERLLVYDYMKNGALYDHLHPKNGEESSVLNSWKMRIKVLLDAARGIEYLHNYAVPPIIHRDIKSSNILLDGNWVARVSDFGLSLMGPESEGEHLSARAAGTIGYMDPEYYGMHHLTVKSDVYGLGVVMLEALTGKNAIFKDEDGNPTSVVDYAVPCVVAGEVGKVLDARVGQPGLHEAEAVELVAYTAVHCVNLEGKDRPSMSDIVANLESALALCEESHGSFSSASISFASAD
ncbi:hypothetical protein B296_00024615 [Ensete ventricosum]|uniref:Protein kinase domain-containing protein n=1 Tax=Ensete ventricosum TaxID=4639 RepID=A0A427ABU4_ENSVE|nr:hypothetical protein B296_00024615 [Ensete ventricosum]